MVPPLTLLTLRWRSPQKALAIGIDLDRVHGDTEAACLAFGHVIRSGDPDLVPAALWWSAVCLRDRGERERAVEFFRRVVESGHADWAPRAESELAELVAGRRDETERRLLERRVILLSSEIDDAEANRVTAQLLLLEEDDPTADIHLYVNSPGGSVTAGMAIYDTMRLIRPDVVTWVAGLAAGIAQVLLSEGAPGRRYALPHAKIMVQKPSGPPDPNPLQLVMLDRTTKEMAGIVAGQTGQPVERIAADSDAGRWFSAVEALDYGLIDGIRDRLGREPG